MQNIHHESIQNSIFDWFKFYNSVRTDEYTKLVNAFSSFLCSQNPSYKYNYPYLPHEFAAFLSFSDAAPQKLELLRIIYNFTRTSKLATKIVPKATISLNDLFVIDYSGKITLHEHHNMSGATSSINTVTFSSTSSAGNPYTIQLAQTSDDIAFQLEQFFASIQSHNKETTNE